MVSLLIDCDAPPREFTSTGMCTTQGQEPGNLGVIRLEPTGIKLGATGDGTFDRRVQICSTFVTQNTTPYKHACTICTGLCWPSRTCLCR